jgi:outer membrane biosynthesis protein TonB
VRRGAAALLTVVVAAAAAADDSPMMEDPRALVLTPVLIVPPDFPREALERRLSGHVDVEAVLTGDGGITAWKLQPDSEASRLFVAEVEQVIGYWRWRPPLGTGCLPADTPIRTRVWFEWEGERHKISVQRASRVVPREPRQGPMPKSVKRVEPGYPREMIRRGVQAQVFALSKISAEGEVISVGTVAYSDKRGVNPAPFEKAVQAALAQWTFEPRPEGAWRHCTTVEFRLRD